MNTKKQELLIKSQALCYKIYENNLYMNEKPINISTKETMISAITALTTSLKTIIIIPDIISTLENTIISIFSNIEIIDTNNLYELINKFILAISNLIAQEMSTEIQTYKGYFDSTISSELLTYISHIPCTSDLILSLNFNIYLKTSATHPEESYNSLMDILKKNPHFFSDTNFHSGYEYETLSVHTFKTCPICGSQGKPFFNAFAFKMRDFQNHDIPFKLWMKCDNCTNLYTYQHPEESLALSNYSSNITPIISETINTTGKSSSFILSTWCDILNSIAKYNSNKNLLEVGIGTGELLAVALELGYKTSAVEIIPSTAQHVSNMLSIPIWNGDFLKFRSLEKYSIIIMGDVIEHITNPKEALEKAYNLLDDDGILWISTPNFESSFSKILKFSDPMWCEPHHITYFSFNGFMNLAEKCNFKLKEYNVSKRYQGSMELILAKN